MAVQLNHTIIASYDPATAAGWFAEMFGIEAPIRYGPFWQVSTSNDVNLDFDAVDPGFVISPQHYAFLVSEEEFDGILGRIVERRIEFFADPAGREAGRYNEHDGGRGLYFPDPSGHWLEIITHPYGTGG